MYHPRDEPQNTSHRLSPFIRLMIIRFFYILCLALCASSSSPTALKSRLVLCPSSPPNPTGFHFSSECPWNRLQNAGALASSSRIIFRNFRVDASTGCKWFIYWWFSPGTIYITWNISISGPAGGHCWRVIRFRSGRQQHRTETLDFFYRKLHESTQQYEIAQLLMSQNIFYIFYCKLYVCIRSYLCF